MKHIIIKCSEEEAQQIVQIAKMLFKRSALVFDCKEQSIPLIGHDIKIVTNIATADKYEIQTVRSFLKEKAPVVILATGEISDTIVLSKCDVVSIEEGIERITNQFYKLEL